MIDRKRIGQRIKTARSDRNITQEVLAEKIGLSANYLSKVERGLNSPSAEVLLKIMDVFNLTLEDFGILHNTNLNSDKRKIINKIMECSDTTIKNITPIIDVIINSFNKISK